MRLLIILTLLSFSAQAKDYIFVGVHAGSSNIDSNIRSEENKEHGQMFGVYLGKEYSYDKWDFNIGIEYNNHKVNTDLDTDQYSKVKLESNYLTIVMNPTYKFKKLNIGLKLDLAVSNDGILISQDDSVRNLVGVNAFYNITSKENKMKIGIFAQKATDQNLSQLGISFQYGFENVKKTSKYQKEYITTITFKDDVVHFENDSAILSLRSKAFLAELGTYLHENSYNWEHLKIIGHTSKDGKLDYNKYLSYKRTNSVFSVLKEMGVSSKKVTLEGKGELEPLVIEKTSVDKRMNRRVELVITGMKKDKDLKRFVDILKRKHK